MVKRIDCDPPVDLEEALLIMPEDYEQSLKATAHKVSKEYRGVLTAEDLVSEWMIWLAAKPAKAKGYWYRNQDTDEEQFSYWAFKRDASDMMARKCRSERNLTLGYFDEDDVIYSPQQIKELLVWVWEMNDILGEGEERLVPIASDPSKGNNATAGVADIRRAYAKVIESGGTWDETLILMYRYGRNAYEAAIELGISRAAVRERHTRAIGALADFLNKPRPPHEGPGSRRALSNAQTLAALREEWF